MKKLSKPIIAIALAITLVMSAAVVSFAWEVSDPGKGNSIYIPIQGVIR